MDIFLLYLWTRLDVVIGISVILITVLSIALMFFSIRFVVAYDEKDVEAHKKVIIKTAKLALIPVALLFVIPSQKDAAIIAGGWAVKQVATSEGAQQISSKTFALINGKLDEELAKLTTKEKEEK